MAFYTYVFRVAKSGLLFLVLTSLLLLCSSCDPLDVHDPIDKAVAVLDKAIATLESESADWRTVLEGTRDQLVDEAQSTIRNEVSNTLTRAVAASGAEFRCNVDFVRTRVRQDLTRIRAKLLRQPVPEKEPALCVVIPVAVDASLVPDRLKWLEFYGYDFDAASVQVILQDGSQYLDVSQHLDKPTHYHMTLNLGRNGVQLSPDSTRFILKWKNQQISSITISQPPSVEPELPPCFWTGHVSEETEPMYCPSGYALRGVRCKGSYCDNKDLYCCPYMPRVDPDAHFNWSLWISEESPNNSYYTKSGFLAGFECKHDYCNNVRMIVLTTPNLRNFGQCSYRPYISEEEGRNQMICEVGSFVAGMRCSGDYCDNISLMCCRSE